MSTPIMKNLQSAPAATSDARGIGNSNPSRVARPSRALFPESARAARPAASRTSARTPGCVVRPGRAPFPENFWGSTGIRAPLADAR